MTIALWCVLAAGLMPYVADSISKAGGKADHHDPRAWTAQQQGYRRRAHAASLNAFEGFPLFAAAVIIAHLLRGPQAAANALALGFIACRILHLLFYVSDRPSLRSTVFGLGMLCVIGLFVISA